VPPSWRTLNRPGFAGSSLMKKRGNHVVAATVCDGSRMRARVFRTHNNGPEGRSTLPQNFARAHEVQPSSSIGKLARCSTLSRLFQIATDMEHHAGGCWPSRDCPALRAYIARFLLFSPTFILAPFTTAFSLKVRCARHSRPPCKNRSPPVSRREIRSSCRALGRQLQRKP
jgi:hypothetical protein